MRAAQCAKPCAMPRLPPVKNKTPAPEQITVQHLLNSEHGRLRSPAAAAMVEEAPCTLAEAARQFRQARSELQSPAPRRAALPAPSCAGTRRCGVGGLEAAIGTVAGTTLPPRTIHI